MYVRGYYGLYSSFVPRILSRSFCAWWGSLAYQRGGGHPGITSPQNGGEVGRTAESGVATRPRRSRSVDPLHQENDTLHSITRASAREGPGSWTDQPAAMCAPRGRPATACPQWWAVAPGPTCARQESNLKPPGYSPRRSTSRPACTPAPFGGPIELQTRYCGREVTRTHDDGSGRVA